jgi:hypothetical protein
MTGASIVTGDRKDRLVIFGTSNILSDLFDCALANGLTPVKVVAHLPEDGDERSVPVAVRVARLAPLCAPPVIEPLSAFRPAEGELYLLGPTTPTRAALADELSERFGLVFHTLVHPTAYVSPLAALGAGTFVGARSVSHQARSSASMSSSTAARRSATTPASAPSAGFSREAPSAGCRVSDAA